MTVFKKIGSNLIEVPCPRCIAIDANLRYEEDRAYKLSCKKCSYSSEIKLRNWYEAIRYFFEKPFSDKEQRLMEHALGLDDSDKPYRNYYETKDDNPDWNDLIRLGFANRKYDQAEIKLNNDNINHFQVTETGREFLTAWIIEDGKTAWGVVK